MVHLKKYLLKKLTSNSVINNNQNSYSDNKKKTLKIFEIIKNSVNL
jgi:hypothetical protein